MSLNTLTTAELTSMRADMEAVTLPDTCVIYAVSNTDDGEGGFSEAWNATATVSCRMIYQSGQEVKAAGAVQAFSGWMLTVPQGATITAANRVSHGGHTYSIQAVNDTSSWLTVKRVQCQRVS